MFSVNSISRYGNSTCVAIAAISILFAAPLWAPTLKLDDYTGYLGTAVLLVYGIRRLFQPSPTPFRLRATECFLLLYLLTVALGLLFNNSDVLTGIRHILYAGIFFLLFPMLPNQEHIRYGVTLVAGILAIAALLYALVDWSLILLKTGKMIRYGFQDLSGNPNLSAFLIMAGVCALTSQMYHRNNNIAWLAIPSVTLLLCLLIFWTRSLLIGLPILAVVFLLKGRLSHKTSLALFITGTAFSLVLFYTGTLQEFLERGFNGRIPIWEDSLVRYHECGLLFGCGNLDSTIFGEHQQKHPHSVYLGTLFYEGLPALLFLLGFLAAFLVEMLQQKKLPVWGASVLIILAASLVTGPKMLLSFSPIWAYLWIPLLLSRSEIEETRQTQSPA